MIFCMIWKVVFLIGIKRKEVIIVKKDLLMVVCCE